MTDDDTRRRWRDPVPDQLAAPKFAAPNESPGDKHAEYLRQAAEHFGGTPHDRTPAELRPQPIAPNDAGPDAQHGAVTQRIPWSAPSPPHQYAAFRRPRIARPGQRPFEVAATDNLAVPPSPLSSSGAAPTDDTGPIQTPSGRRGVWPNPGAARQISAQPRPTGRPIEGPAPSPTVVLIATALIVVFGALVFWWLFLPSFFLAVYIVVALAGGVGYLLYRSQNLATAKELETKLTAELTTVAAHLMVLWQKVTATSQFFDTGHAGPRQLAVAPYTDPTARHRGPQPPPFVPRTPYTSRSWPTSQGGGTNSAVISALLIIPSAIAYGIVYHNTGFDSVWQPWAILMALNGYFVLCVAGRSRPERRPSAILLAVIATAVYAFVTSPSPDVGLGAMVQSAAAKAKSVADMQELMLWSQRAPAITILVFIVAWSLARRVNSSWLLGLLPAAGIVAFSIWYSENEWSYAAGWFGLWLLHVGVFMAGCVACWLADAMGGAPKPNVPASPTSTWTM